MTDGLYIYGVLADGDGRLDAEGFGKVRLLDHAWCTAIASRVPLSDWQGAAMEDAAELERRVQVHFSVLQAALSYGTPVPMRFGAVVPADGLASFLDAGRADIEKGLAVAAAGREWVMHLGVEPHQLRTWSSQADPELRLLEERIAQASAGTAYLLAKQRDQRLAAIAEDLADSVSQSLVRRLSSSALDHVDLPARAKREKRIAWLVPSEREESFVATTQRAAAETGIAVRLVGPSPPYSFVASNAARHAE